MRMLNNDFSELIAPMSGPPARLVVTFSSQPSGENFDVAAEVDGQTPLTTQFTMKPHWQAQEQGRSASREYLSDPLHDVGAELFSALFSGSLSRVWAQTVDLARVQGGLHIVIRSTSLEVQSLPWELLSDTTLTSSEHFAIAEGWSVLRDARMPNADEPSSRRTTLTPRADIEVAALTTPLPGVDQEADIRILTEVFGDEAVTADRNVDAEAVLHRLASSSAHIVHITATGRRGRHFMQDLVLDVGQVGRLGLLQAIETPDKTAVVKGRDLVAAAQKATQLELVVLAACETDQLAARLASVVPAVIGIRGSISDEGCQAFLRGLYGALASGGTLTQAVAAGRLRQVVFSGSLGDEWAQPVLYLSTDAPVVATATAASVAEAAVAPPLTATLIEIKQANLRALKDQWGWMDSKEVPVVVTEQINSLDREVHGLTGGSS